jgi:dTMP kinase
LAEGQWVLCDRFADSTVAYQGYGRGLDLATLGQITAFATGGLRPHRTIYFEIDAAVGLERRRTGQLEMNRMDLQQKAFYERVRAGYGVLMAAEPERWVSVDGARPIEAIQEELRCLVDVLWRG